MAINKKLIIIETKDLFNKLLANLADTSIVFIQDTGELWTHGKLFAGNFSSVNNNKISLTLAGLTIELSKASHTHSYLPLSGGTLTIGSFYGLTIKRNSANGSAILFSNSNGALAGIGILADKSFVVSSGSTTSGDIFKVTSSGVAYAGGVELSKVGHTHSYLPLTGGTLSGSLTFSSGNILFNTNSVLRWSNGTYLLQISITDDSSAGTPVFKFQQSSNSGGSWSTLASIYDNGYIHATGFYKNGSSDSLVLLAGGGAKNVSDFALSSSLSNYVLKSNAGSAYIIADSDSSTTSEYLSLKAGKNELKVISNGSSLDNNKLTYNGYKIWHSGNQGSGSGLDADKLDGKNSDYFTYRGGVNNNGGTAYVSGDTHIMQLGYFNCSGNYDSLTLQILSAFWGNQHGSSDILFFCQSTNTNDTPRVQVTGSRVRLDNKTNRTYYYRIDNTNKRVYVLVYVSGGNSYGRWITQIISQSSSMWVSEVKFNLPTTSLVTIKERLEYENIYSASKLQTARSINGTSFDGTNNITTANWGTTRTLTIGNKGKSVNGSGNVSWSLSEIGAASSGHNHDSTYVNVVGDTMTGLLTVTSGSSHRGVKVGEGYINAIGKDLIFQNVDSLRFGSDSWDWNSWGGLTYKDKTIYLGAADGTIFDRNSSRITDAIIKTPGVNKMYIGDNTTNLVWHAGNDGANSGLDADKLDGKHASEFATSGHTHSYLPLSGGTITGALNFANNTWNKVGDDVYIGDHNTANCLCVKANSGTKVGLAFYNSSDGAIGKLTSTNNTLQWNNTNVSLSGHTHSYLPYQDTRYIDYSPYDSNFNKGLSSTHLKANSVDGLNDGGTWHTSLYLYPWIDSSGGPAHNLAFTNNGNMWIRSGTSSWDDWKEIWHSGNDGSGSGLDADLLDGIHGSGYLKINNTRFSLYNQGTYTKILQFTIPSGSYSPSISFIWHPSECARGAWGDFNINIRSGNILFYVNWKGATERTLYCVGDGTTYSVWVLGSKTGWDPFGVILITNTYSINSYSTGSLGYLDTEPTGTYKATATLSGFINVAKKLGTSTVGGSTTPIYLSSGTPTACSASTSGNANTIAVRDGSGDIACRLVRPTYGNQTTISGALAFRVNNSSDNYIRFCSNTAAIRTWLGAAASSHTHSYLPLSGGTLTGPVSNSYNTGTYLAGNLGKTLINSTAGAGSYVMLFKGNSTNGYFTHGVYQGSYLLQYTAKSTVTSGINSVTKSVTLLNESGNSSFPGTVTASTFSGNLTNVGSLYFSSSTGAYFDSNGNIKLRSSDTVDISWNIMRGDGKPTFSVQSSTGNITMGSTAMHVLYGGNVGIGTTSPSVKLHVIGSSIIGNSWCTATGIYSCAFGSSAKADGDYSCAQGSSAKAGGDYSCAFGYYTKADGEFSYAQGYLSEATNNCAHAEGDTTIASGVASHAEGDNTIASNSASHAEGYYTRATGSYSHALNYRTLANYAYQTAIGKCNTNNSDYFIIGNGSLSNTGNAFRVTSSGYTYADGPYSSSGADYAECFEWIDDNINSEDRVGYFVTLKGNKILIATETDNYILGIVSSNPVIIGSNPIEWNKKYLTDEWGRPLYDWIEVDHGNGKVTLEKQYKFNPDYDCNTKYISRDERPEWGTVGLMGQLLVRQDGSLSVGDFCKCGNNGIATKSDSGYYVMEIKSEKIAKILFK